MAWIHGMAFLGTAVLLCVRLRQSIARTLPLTICLMMPALLILAMLGRLGWTDGLAVLLLLLFAARLAVWFRKTPKGFALAVHFLQQYVLSPALLCFVMLVLFWTFGSRNRAVLDYDEYSYWATQVRSLFMSNGLVRGTRSCCVKHAAYTPGMQLVEWWFMHLNGVWHEGTLYTAAFLTNSLFMLPLAERIRWKQWWRAPLYAIGIIALPTVFTGYAYSFLGVDTTQGMLFGLMLYTIWNSPEERHTPFVLGAQMTAMALIKQSGVLWALFALSLGLLLSTQRRRMLRALPAPLAALGIWLLYCRAMGLHSVHFQTLGSGDGELWANTLSVWRGTLKILLMRPLSMNGAWGGMRPLAGIPPVACMVILCLLVRGVRHIGSEKRKRTALWMAAMFAAFVILLAIGFPTLFAPELYRWARNRQYLWEIIDRYMIPVFYGAGYLTAAIVLREPAGRRPSRKLSICKGGMCVALLLCINWQTLLCLTPQGYASRFPTDNGTELMREGLDWYRQIERPQDSRLLTTDAMTSSYGYALVPLSIVRVPSFPQGHAFAETVREWIEQQDATHLLIPEASDETRRVLETAFDCEIEPDRLYLINRETDPYSLNDPPSLNGVKQ